MLETPTEAGFAAFARGKPGDETYEYINNQNCLIAQYLKSLGYTEIWVTGFGKWEARESEGRLEQGADAANRACKWRDLVKRLKAARDA